METWQIMSEMKKAMQGQGRAIRREEEEPYPEEPYMSMDDAYTTATQVAYRLLKQESTQKMAERIAGTGIFVGLVIAVIAAILYFLKLPIFNEIAVSWVIFAGLFGAGLAGIGLALKGIWGDNQ